jgi:TPR repeat protein
LSTSEAFKLLLRVAEDTESLNVMLDVARRLEKGDVVAADKAAALRWYKRCCALYETGKPQWAEAKQALMRLRPAGSP